MYTSYLADNTGSGSRRVETLGFEVDAEGHLNATVGVGRASFTLIIQVP